MSEPLRSILSPVYGDLLPGVFDRAAVVETRATCNDCAMCDKGTGPVDSLVEMDFFRPDLKCCTFQPHLPNYLAGAVFADPDPALEEGRRRLRAAIADRYGATPRWLGPSRRMAALQEASRKSGHFGKSDFFVCPYLDRARGLCTVWTHRDAVCSTYFCKYTRGRRGTAFWRAVKNYLGYVEGMLSSYVVFRVAPEMKPMEIGRAELTLDDLEGRPPNEKDWRLWWGKWVGREEQFYVAAYAYVKNMKKAEFDSVRSRFPEERERLHALVKTYEELSSDALPTHLVVNPKVIRKVPTDTAVIFTSYNPYDSFAVDKDLFEVLEMFDAKETVTENLARLERDHEIGLAPELVAELYTHGVLAPPDEPSPDDSK